MLSNSYLENSILNICENEYEYFLNKPNVVGIGLGFKDVRNIQTLDKSIIVFVDKKIPCNCLPPSHLIPSVYKDIKTDVVETGTLSTNALSQRVRPVTGGFSIGPSGVFITGSYGGLVTKDSDFYILSNNHLLSVEGLVPLNQPILQPGGRDGGVSPTDIIANLSEFIPIFPITPTSMPENFVDCAIAKVSNINLVSPYITYIGTPKGTTTPKLNTEVQAACRTSTYLQGPIKSIGTTIKITFAIKGKCLFKNQIIVDVGSEKGNSGALLLDKNKYVVGLIFSGSSEILICNPIDSVLKSLNVSLVTRDYLT